MPRLRGVSTFLMLAFSASASVAAQTPDTTRRHSGLAGLVRDSTGRPISAASVLVDGSNVAVATDDSGHFDVRRLPAGPNGFTITKIGYAPLSFELSLPADSVVVLSVTMRSVQVLNTVNIKAERTNAALARVGFVERQHVGIGSFLTPEHLDSIAMTVTTPAQFLRGVRGIDVVCPRDICKVVAHSPPGCLWLYIDGVPHGTQQIDDLAFSPSGIAAIEVYERPYMVPLEFQGQLPIKQGRNMSLASGCGALAIWTKARIP
jgi:carboxypeptidase family protein